MKPYKHKKSLLYKITSPELKKPSYILGTMHAVCANDFLLGEKVLSALKKCSAFYMEVDLGSAEQLRFMEQQIPAIADITSGLSDAAKSELGIILKDQFDLSLEEANQQGPLTLINRMTRDAINCDDIKVAEMELLKIALENGLQTGGLETASEQLNIARKVFTGKEILRQLKSADIYKELFDQMVDAYHSENLQELSTLVTDLRFMSRRAYNMLVTDRNRRWANAIPSLLESNNAFFAVGAGHLPGEEGILRLLTEAGYIVNPVYK